MSRNTTTTTTMRLDTTQVQSQIDQLQKKLKSLTIPKGMEKEINESFGKLQGYAKAFYAEMEKAPGDRNLRTMENSLKGLQKGFQELKTVSDLDFMKGRFKEEDLIPKAALDRIRELRQEIENLKATTSGLSLDALKGFQDEANKLKIGKTAQGGEFSYHKTALANVEAALGAKDLQAANEALDKAIKFAQDRLGQSTGESHRIIKDFLEKVKSAVGTEAPEIAEKTEEIFKIKEGAIRDSELAHQAMQRELDETARATGNMGQEMLESERKVQAFNEEADRLKNSVKHFFSLAASIQLVRKIVGQAVATVKELDAVMTETAVVTDFSIGDMWEKLPEYTAKANELGAATKGVYEVLTLFYQQGYMKI